MPHKIVMLPRQASSINTIYELGVDLYYNDGNGNVIRLTAGGTINASALGFVNSVTGLNTDNTDTKNPIVKISVDGSSITGLGTPGSPLIAHSSAITGAALTKTDDTNVTITLGGSPSTALLVAASLTLGWTGQLAISRGGTGASTALGSFNAFSPLTTRGDILTRDASNNIRIAIGSSGKFLRSDGTDPSWQTLVSGDIPNLGGNPSVSVGLTAANGSATTYIRSDGAPALSQAIVPTWTGLHTFSIFPVTPSSAPTTSFQVSNKKYVDDSIAAIPSGGTTPYFVPTGTTTTINEYSQALWSEDIELEDTGILAVNGHLVGMAG